MAKKADIPTPVREKTLKMSDGVLLSLRIFSLSDREIAAFLTEDVSFVSDSVLYEVFLSVGLDVCAISRSGETFEIKLFSPSACDFSLALD